MPRLLAIVPYALGTAPGQRLRIERWARHLTAAGWTVDFAPFGSPELAKTLYQPGQLAKKTMLVAGCALRQARRMLASDTYDICFVYREAALVGPALGERWLRRSRCPFVYDLDDPAFIPYSSPTNGRLARLKCQGKTDKILNFADTVVAINEPIAAHARLRNGHVTIVPNYVDCTKFVPGGRDKLAKTTLVWIGSHSSVGGLLSLGPVLRKLRAERDFDLLVIGAEPVDIPGVQVVFRSWSEVTEAEDLRVAHIGLAPASSDQWAAYKFHYKILQYMACGLPVVAARLDANRDLISDGRTGFTADSDAGWRAALRRLIDDGVLRKRMGGEARRDAIAKFSVDLERAVILSIFESVLVSQGSAR